MKKLMLSLVALAALLATPALQAQTAAATTPGDLSGNWQGTLKVGKDLRIIFNIYKGDKDGWSAKMYSIDQTPQPIPVASVTRQGSSIKIAVEMIGGSFEGKLDANGRSIAGTWTQGGQPFPLTLVRATPETAWDIPDAPKPPTPMAADADPSFEVATIKPNPSGGPSLQGLVLHGRETVVTNGSLIDLLKFAYNLQVNQIVGAPGWTDSDRDDIVGIPDQPGQPNVEQMRSMVRKLLADRFKLTSHQEKRDLSAYVLTVGKTGQKLTPTQIKGNLPGFSYSPGTGGLTLHLVNGTMKDFTDFLQMLVLDKPVVDQTGITGRFDSNVTFTPDQAQFNGNPPKLKAADVPDAPDLFTAIQQQLGLKLTAEKTAVDVLVIDHVEKPSPN
ncbi:MAG: TIGR03435 family protein [Acidobacteriaceae bacterium]